MACPGHVVDVDGSDSGACITLMVINTGIRQWFVQEALPAISNTGPDIHEGPEGWRTTSDPGHNSFLGSNLEA